ncbi:glycine zipper 2TM domain-containing protein [Sphingomonas sp. PB2P12]|uniref:glycine zipper 2TM domain-containing protein n=1 Tax=Sphingomonas sandaracina TaxID=3096157 RepID=UPI00103F2B1E
MFKTFTLAASALALGATALVPAAADAQRWGSRYERGYDGYQGGYQGGYRDGGYDRGYREYRGNDRRYNYNARSRRGCDNTGGTIIGALAGGLLGHTIAGRGDRTLGAVLGAAGGGLAGNAIDKSDNPGYCRR